MKKDAKKISGSIALRGGSYTLAITAIVLAILIGVNLLVSALPANATKFDISSSKLYSITSNTKAVVSRLQEDVTIYWIVQADQEDDVLTNLLQKYESLSDHIQVVKRNPDAYPTFAAQYTDEAVTNNSLVVECGEKSRYIPNSDIYVQEADVYSYSYNTSFDGEGAITSAIDYVISQDLPKVYLLQGHGEAELPERFREQMEKENMALDSLSLLTVDQIPEDADCILVYSPASDLSGKEAEMLQTYAASGGKLFVMAGPVSDGTLPCFNSILDAYGVTAEEGIVVESDRNYYAFQYPYVLMPDLSSSEITNALMEERYLPVMPICTGLQVSGADSSVTTFLTTSDTAFSKASGYSLDTYDFEEGDREGPFALGVSISCENEGQIVWISCASFLESMYNAYSSGANYDLAMNALSSLIGQREALSIRSKSLNYNYLTISESTSTLLKAGMIGVFPLVYLCIGIAVVVVRRRRQNEAR